MTSGDEDLALHEETKIPQCPRVTWEGDEDNSDLGLHEEELKTSGYMRRR